MSRKTILLTSLVCLMPIFFGICVYQQLPDQIPIHWDISGRVDDYASKLIAVFGLPLLMLAFHYLSLFMMYYDPKHKNYSDKMKMIVIWLIPILTVVLESLTYAIVFGKDFSINFVVPIIMGIIFIVVGNYLPKCRRNYTLGIKLPWTLNDDDNWNKTNRLGGYIMVAGGFFIIIMSIFDLAFVAAALAVLAFMLIPMCYSFLIYRKTNKFKEE